MMWRGPAGEAELAVDLTARTYSVTAGGVTVSSVDELPGQW